MAKPIEDAISTVGGVKTITSNAASNLAVITIKLNGGVDTERALQDVREKVNGIRSDLPDGIEEPIFARVDLSSSPIITLAVTSSSGQDARTVRTILNDEVLPLIRRASGVGSITITITSTEFRTTSTEFRTTSTEFRTTSTEFRTTSTEFRTTST
ncbi:MAG: efflux RND transporter permease subunit, partial [Oscillochloris sp.]|nr:efflux RND transporter permease subunit [Oscillochloris sp.]